MRSCARTMSEKNSEQKIVFADTQTGETIEFYVVEQTRVNNHNYLMVTEADDDEMEAAAYILKDLSKDEDTEAEYVMVDDDNELEAVSKIFAELLEDVDIEISDAE